jgi:uncharacterized protein DUF4232
MDRRLIACGFLGLALVVSACGAKQAATGSASSTAKQPPTSSVASTPAVPLSSTSPAAAPPPRSTKCVADSLSAKVEMGEPAAGNRYAKLVFTNIGTTPCTLTGYSGFQLRANGADIATSTNRVLDPAPSTVALAPKASAAANLHWTVVATGSESADGPCEPEANAAAAIAPDDTKQIELPWTFGPVCGAGAIDMSAFYAA